MRGERLRIEPLSPEHVPEVAALHRRALTVELKGWTGQRLLELFYRELVASHDPPPGFAAFLGPRLVGYAIAVADAPALRRRVLRRYPLQVLLLGLLHALRYPRELLARVVRRLRPVASERAAVAGPDPLEACSAAPRVEFRGIVVDPEAHCPGAPLALMKARLAWARAAGFRTVYFQIDPDNLPSIRLCEWAGGKRVPNDEGRAWLRYFIQL